MLLYEIVSIGCAQFWLGCNATSVGLYLFGAVVTYRAAQRYVKIAKFVFGPWPAGVPIVPQLQSHRMHFN